MFGKFKKVLMSLALATSLALAPMNVYGANGTQSGSKADADGKLCGGNDANIETPINVTLPTSYSWTVIVPDSFSLDSKNEYADSGSIALNSGGILGSKKLKVTPELNREETYNIAENYPIGMTVTAGVEGTSASVANGAVSFTADKKGAASLGVSITESTWKASCPDGLNNVKVAGIKYAISLE